MKVDVVAYLYVSKDKKRMGFTANATTFAPTPSNLRDFEVYELVIHRRIPDEG